MGSLVPLWIASGAVASTVGLPITASVGIVGLLAALNSNTHKQDQHGAEVEEPGSPQIVSDDAEKLHDKSCLSHALSSITPRCHALDQDSLGSIWDTQYPSRQPSQLMGDDAPNAAALPQLQQEQSVKQRSQRYRKMVLGLSARLSTLCHASCLAPKTANSGAAQQAAKQAAAGRAMSRRSSRGLRQAKLDMLRTASSLQQRISIVASSATGQRTAQGAIAAFHVPSRHLATPKRKQGPWIAHMC
ncbi:hypothetical protein COCOBI_01-0430 [Coccomyxa sp. Obi]|nr:hypothetical protein COCOBI_01-0430 [Coccomyxa sp. Obi]